MESSAEQALLIGVNVFIFIIAVTCAILLMTTLLDMSETANTVIKNSADTSLMELYGGTEERIYTGEQVLATIQEYFSPTSNIQDRLILQMGGVEVKSEYTKQALNSKYHLNYVGKCSDEVVCREDFGKLIYSFEKI